MGTWFLGASNPKHSPEWLLEIGQTIGGSSAADACGQGRYRTRHDLWNAIVGARRNVVPEALDQTPDMLRGSLLEPIALSLLAKQLGEDIVPADQTRFMYHSDYEWAHVLLDGTIGDDCTVEVKVPRPGTIANCESRGLPAYWTIQALHGLLISNRVRCWFGLLNPITCEVTVFKVERDDALLAKIIERERELWQWVVDEAVPATIPDNASPFIEADDRPPPVGKAMLPRYSEPKLVAAVRRVLALGDIVHEAQEALLHAKEDVEGILGAIPECIVEGVRFTSERTGKRYENATVYWRQQKPRRIFDKDAAIAKHGDLADDPAVWKDGAAARPLRIYPGA